MTQTLLPMTLSDLTAQLAQLTPLQLFGAGSLHCAMGILAAIVAHRKGYAWSRWLPGGLLAGTPALVMALWLKPRETDDTTS